MRVYRDITDSAGNYVRTDAVFDIMEATYTGQDMGRRSVSATIKFPTPIDFRIGDYIVVQMQSLERNPGGNHGSVLPGERFYIYTEPQCKKSARSMMAGDAFEITVTFYPRQYELAGIQFRDIVQKEANDELIMYTGFDTVSFYGGAKELLDRCMACLAQQYKDSNGNPLWSYQLHESLDETHNNALERYPFSFQGNSVMDALLKLNDKEYINTTFFINDRTIYVGYKRPFLCKVNAQGAVTDTPLKMTYGKTSHLPIDLDHGGLFNITKTVGEEIPVTKLFAYGAARNLNRYYCSDRIQSGRFVNKLMLPSFSDDGETDYVLSEDGIKKYGIHEGSKVFDEIYPSLRYITYADIRGIKYCIKVKTCGLEDDTYTNGVMEHFNSRSKYPVARVQCYKVVPCTGIENQMTGEVDGTVGLNKLVECAPPEDLVIFIHATGKTVKVVLYGDDDPDPAVAAANALAKQQQAAGMWTGTNRYRVPTRTYEGTDYIPGACFCVHDPHFRDIDDQTYEGQEAEKLTEWFESDFDRVSDSGSIYYKLLQEQGPSLHRIEYVDTFWLTDLYVMGYDSETGDPLYDNQRNFKREGYSAWAWPRYNNESIYPDSLPVNEVVAVEPIVIADTSDNLDGGRQQHWDVYLRDIGFAIDEQNDFGEMVFVFSTPVVSVLDGVLAGREFTIDGGENLNDFQDRVVCAYNEDGSLNRNFFVPGDSGNESVPERALLNGAMWRIRLNRNNNDSELSSIGIVLPNTDIAMKEGAHVVLLDIYMPDIYIRAAEQRLLREAQWYLEKNDKSNVKYSINLDKVRFNQIPTYATQMREGMMLRMVDDDLRITSENTIRKIVEHAIPAEKSVPLYIMDKILHEDEVKETTYWYYKENCADKPKTADVAKRVGPAEEIGYSTWKISVPKHDGVAKYAGEMNGSVSTDASCFKISNPPSGYAAITNFKLVDLMDRYAITFDCPNVGSFGAFDPDGVTLKVEFKEKLSWSESKKAYPTEDGTYVPAICHDFVHFKAGKFYEVVVDLQELEILDVYNKYCFRRSGTHGTGENTENNDQIFLSISPTELETYYKIPEYEKTFVRNLGSGMYRFKYKFYLPDSFNEGSGYYLSFLYFNPNHEGADRIDFGKIRLVSVTEKDTDSTENVVNYVDFKVTNITIKMTDNTRPAADNSGNVDMRERVIAQAPEMVYDITAQIEEQTKASSWGSLMNITEKTRIESEQNKRSYEMLAQAARQNYQNLLNLRNNIFDPDGTCNSVFLQVMMMQVGADSMNYQLHYTERTVTGDNQNFSLRREVGETYMRFHVYADDVLDHFVYTKGSVNGGTWEIPGNFDAELIPEVDDQGNIVYDEAQRPKYPTYYICIRCKKDDANDLSKVAWICSPYQYACNQDVDPASGAATASDGETVADYWYFNWGILTADSDGNYTLMETRGNAYMYGDNIVAGKISTIAGNSFFDLTHGNFVLSKYGPDATTGAYHDGMTYIDGVLTIFGLNDLDNPESVLNRLGLIDDSIEGGGRNLLRGTRKLNLDQYGNWNDAAWRGTCIASTRSILRKAFAAGETKPVLDSNNYVEIRLNENVSDPVDIVQENVYPVEKDVTYTLSVYAKALSQNQDLKLHMEAKFSNEKNYKDESQFLTQNWKRYSFTFNWRYNETPDIYIGIKSGSANDGVAICAMKLERGTYTTDWTVAPEDLVDDIKEQKDHIDAIQQDLQNQIDGVVDSYFMEGVPSMDVTRKPLSDWDKDDNNNIIFLRHEGDTYTDILKAKANLGEYVGGKPYWFEQGGYALTSGKPYYDDRGEAANRCRTKGVFVNELGAVIPAPPSGFEFYIAYYDANYEVVDSTSWLTTAYTLIGGSGNSYKFFAIIYKKTDGSDFTPADIVGLSSTQEFDYPFAGHSWRLCNMEDNDATTWHWHEIADSDAVLALQKAAAAQDTADGKRRVWTTQPVPPYDEGDLWANATYNGNGVSYDNVLLKCKYARATGSFDISDWEDSSRAITAADNAYNEALKNGGVRNYFAKKFMMEWNDTHSGTVDAGVDSYGEYIMVAQSYVYNYIGGGESYNDILQGKVKFLSNTQYTLKVKWRASGVQTYAALIIGFKYSDGTRENIFLPATDTSMREDVLVSASGKTVVGIFASYGDSQVFTLIYEISLTEGNKVPVGWIEAEEDQEAGGENLANYDTADATGSMSKTNDRGFEQTGENSSDNIRVYIDSTVDMSYNYVDEAITRKGHREYSFSIKQDLDVLRVIFLKGNNWFYSTFTLPETLTAGTRVVVSFDVVSLNPKIKWKDVMIQKGGRATSYQNYVKHLTSALKGSTEVTGGLVMTNLLMLKNEAGQVKSGMSGLTEDNENVAMWAGGDYQAALSQAAGNIDTLPVLITKNGIGSKIGPFKIVAHDKVQISSGQGKITLQTTRDGGIHMFDNNDNEKIVIVPDSISHYQPQKAIIGKHFGIIDAHGSPSGDLIASLTIDANADINIYNLAYNGNVIIRKAGAQATETLYNSSLDIEIRRGNTVVAAHHISNAPLSPNDAYSNNHYQASNKSIAVGNNLPAGEYKMYLVRTQGNDPSVSIYDFAEISFQYNVIPSLPEKTIVGTDGLLCSKDGEHYFLVDNSGQQQRIVAQGLSTTKGNDGSGELYVSGNFIDAFRVFLNYFRNTLIPDLRYIGSNAQHAEEMQDYTDIVIEKLDDSALIAVS